ncbi:hypothetical protein QVD99_004887 [Batrachochytrium dendrobatidis]|nr:hypothetical protein O5D80_004668 [Batrachochytrium dendrobatidis]KAK5667838.1 hypothetical protein QVD99_004887 [Batrachochytrium dendrobatidis]
MDIDEVFKTSSSAVGQSDKRKQPTSNGSSMTASSMAKRAKTGHHDNHVEIRESTDEEFHTRWGTGNGSSRKTISASSASASTSHLDDDRADTAQQQHKRLQDLVDAGQELPSVIDLALLKRILLRFEKSISKNQSQRIKHADDPLKYLDSEADLVEEIKTMTTISSVPELYPAMLDLGTHQSILALVSHENTDIAIAALELIDELTDEDLAGKTSGSGEEGMEMLVHALVEHDAFPLLVQNLNRLDESRTDDKQGIFNTLSVIENFVAIDPQLSEKVVTSTNILPWLLARISQKTAFDSIRQYASEILTILLQTSQANRCRVIALTGMDTLLRVISPYRRKDPADSDEIEFMENVFDTLCLCLDLFKGKMDFLKSEGIELMLIMIKNGKMSRMRAVKVIDHLLLRDIPLDADATLKEDNTDQDNPSEHASIVASTHLIEAFGLKTLFKIFMEKGAKKYKKMYEDYSRREDEEHIISIIASLFRSIKRDDLRDRLLFKLIESDFEKTRKFMALYQTYTALVKTVDAHIAERRQRAKDELEEDGDMMVQDDAMAYLDRLGGGLFTLQLIALILAYACEESYEVREIVFGGEVDIESIQNILKEYADNLGDGNDEADTKTLDIQEEKTTVMRLVKSLGAEQPPLPTRTEAGENGGINEDTTE